MTTSNVTSPTSTDGVRGVPTTDWSERNILDVALSAVRNTAPSGAIAISFDGRGGSADLAAMCAAYLERLGIRVLLSASVGVTPALGRYCARNDSITGGLMFTASHNPPGYVGVKVRGPDGLGFEISENAKSGSDDYESNWDLGYSDISALERSDAVNELYIREVAAPLDSAVNGFDGRVTIDPMFGAASRYRDVVPSATWVRATVAPFFFGVSPDPVLEMSRVDHATSVHLDGDELGVLTDGDGDRIVLLTKQSGYISSTELALCLLVDIPRGTHMITTNVAEKSLRDNAQSACIPYHAVDVGYKNIISAWKRLGRPPAIGVEPNGGLSLALSSEDYFERDGLRMAARVLTEFDSVRSLDEAVSAVRKDRDFRQVSLSAHESADTIVTSLLPRFSRFELSEHGCLHEITAPCTGERVLLRQSGTEDVTRIYVEAAEDVGEWLVHTYSRTASSIRPVIRSSGGRDNEHQ